jgi:hypothetical protein
MSAPSDPERRRLEVAMAKIAADKRAVGADPAAAMEASLTQVRQRLISRVALWFAILVVLGMAVYVFRARQ